MTFHEDLSPYTESPEDTFWESEGTRVVSFTPRYRRINIGWLTAEHPHTVGPPPPGFVRRLDRVLDGQYVNATLGRHACELCEAAGDVRGAPCGSSEIRVPGSPTEVYAAPFLIGHYVQAHRYLPPRPFVEAVSAWHDTWRDGPPAPWLPDDARRLDFEAGD
ncbi:hypothetical protein ACFZAU_01875 [Streptomyces sp. NPDC008238]